MDVVQSLIYLDNKVSFSDLILSLYNKYISDVQEKNDELTKLINYHDFLKVYVQNNDYDTMDPDIKYMYHIMSIGVALTGTSTSADRKRALDVLKVLVTKQGAFIGKLLDFSRTVILHNSTIKQNDIFNILELIIENLSEGRNSTFFYYDQSNNNVSEQVDTSADQKSILAQAVANLNVISTEKITKLESEVNQYKQEVERLKLELSKTSTPVLNQVTFQTNLYCFLYNSLNLIIGI